MVQLFFKKPSQNTQKYALMIFYALLNLVKLAFKISYHTI